MIEKIDPDETDYNEEFLESILESSFYGIMTFKSIRDSKGNISDFQWLYVNDVAAELVGVDAERLRGANLLTVMKDSKEFGLFHSYCKVVDTGEYLTFEQEYPNGESKRQYRVSAVKIGDGLTVTFQDITEFKNSLLESKIREDKYRLLFEESIDSIFVIDNSFMFLDANQSFQKLFGFDLDQLVCMSFKQLFPDEEKFKLFSKMLLDNQTLEEFEVDLCDFKGIRKICLINCSTVSDVDPETRKYLGVIRDQTKRKQSDKELIQAEKLAMTGKIARTIAHEVRNPLTNLTLALEQLKDEIPEEIEDADLYFNIIKRNAERIGKLITNLLQSSKPRELKLEMQSINEILTSSIDLVKDRLNLRKIELKTNFEPNLPDIPLDKDQLSIALLNLFVNAIEAMKSDVGVLEVSSTAIEGKVLVRISDNGKGMSQDDQNKLFEPFFTSKKEGTGLGLTMVQNIVHSHKGSIHVESELKKGTAFTIYFPVPED